MVVARRVMASHKRSPEARRAPISPHCRSAVAGGLSFGIRRSSVAPPHHFIAKGNEIVSQEEIGVLSQDGSTARSIPCPRSSRPSRTALGNSCSHSMPTKSRSGPPSSWASPRKKPWRVAGVGRVGGYPHRERGMGCRWWRGRNRFPP